MIRSFNLVWLGVFVIFASPVCMAANGGTPNGKPFVEIQGQFVQVQGSIQSLQEQMDALVTQVSSFEGRIAANENAILGLEATNVVIQADIDSLIATSSANSDEISSALNRIGVLEEEIANLSVDIITNAFLIASLGDEIQFLNDSITVNIEGLQSLISQIMNNLVLINAFQQQIEDINAQLAIKQNVLNGQCEAGSVLKSFDGLGEIVCQSINVAAGISKETITTLFTIGAQTTSEFCTDIGSFHQHCGLSCSSHFHSNVVCVTNTSPGGGSGIATCPNGTFLANCGFAIGNTPGINITATHSTGTFEHPGQSCTISLTNNSTTPFDAFIIADCISFLP